MSEDPAAADQAVEDLNWHVANFAAHLAKTRPILDSDKLASLVSPRARLEFDLDAVDAFVFTVDGVLQGKKVVGALLAGECILVRAKSAREAQELANAGLRDTIKLLHEEYATRDHRGNAELLSVEAGGRRNRPSPGEPLAHMPKLQEMLRNAFKGGRR